MRYRWLGRTGLRVSELSLGTMTFGTRAGATGGVDRAGADELVGRALELGVNLFDTADVYARGQAEELLGRALGPRRDEVLVATKGGIRFGRGVNAVGSSRVHLTRQLDASLRRLGTDRVDLYYVHIHDDRTAAEEVAATLDGFVRSGKVLHVAASDYPAWRLMEALGVSERRGWTRFAALQALWNPLARDVENELVPLCRAQELGFLSWGALAGGLLSGKYRRGAERPAGARLSDAAAEWLGIDEEQAFDLVEGTAEIGAARGASPAQVAIAWQLARPWLTSVVLGARTVAQLEDTIAAGDVELTAEELARLEALAPAPRRWPAWHVELERPRRE